MDISVERSVADLQQAGQKVFCDIVPRVWWGYSVIVLITGVAFYVESSVSWGPGLGKLEMQAGGPVSYVALFSGLGFFVYQRVQGNRVRLRLRQTVRNSDTVFCHLRDSGIQYGVGNVWNKFYSWRLISSIRFDPSTIWVSALDHSLSLETAMFEPPQLEEMKSYFAMTRETVDPEPFFGWRRKRRVGREEYGKWKQ